ncbi:hypothetical protein [Sphingosinicella sp. LY1275]|uniref:hypothetical protein n=1 Tax=Sphingosinicella sp. LY1275 TaxID=3095379 RepID=UPI002ADEAC03|nr:hypothetical protein [Sphingosinicella sp. LY1275]MEA1015024.1 hypothetical protein [Sphingosinicella sp. LY1275]
MSDQVIPNQTDGADRVAPADKAGKARSSPYNGLFGAKLLGETGTREQRATPRLPRSLY